MTPGTNPIQSHLHGLEQVLPGYTRILELQNSPFLPLPAPGCLADGMYFMETTSSPLYWCRAAASAPACREVTLAASAEEPQHTR